MGFNLPPAGNDGYWGPVTATLDWCEENYTVSYYIAEWWNTWSNLIFPAAALVGVWSSWQTKSEARIYAMYLALAVVGAGSFAFHATLTYTMQLSDELPMIYGTCVSVFVLALMWPPERGTLAVTAGLVVYSVAVTAIYVQIRNPVFHEVSYGLLVAATVILPIRHLLKMSDTHPKETRTLVILFVASFTTYITGFVLWNIENLNCVAVREWRARAGFPLRVVGQLHSWWHLLTGIGAYGSSVLNHYMRLLALGRKDVRIKWLLLVFPLVVADESRKRE
ncbi:alkaline ceramidase 3 [Entophlyctis helioformis]|nr:alkaline ceramidase 3 [Entophlyctis helioformis]